MRLNIEQRVVGSSIHVVVTGNIDWSTLGQFRNALRKLVAGPCPDVRMDLAGLLSWSPEAHIILMRAVAQARLHGGELVVSELRPVPRWEADGAALPVSPAPVTARYRYRQMRTIPELQPAAPMAGGLRLVPPLP